MPDCTVPLQELQEPGEDNTRYDTLLTTVVRPPKFPLVREHLNMATLDYSDEEEEEDDVQLGILKQFTFSSELQVSHLHCRQLHLSIQEMGWS